MIDHQGAVAGLGGAYLQILVEGGRGLGSVGDLALLTAFAADANPAFGSVEIVEIQAGQFTDAEAAAVEELEEKQIALGVGAFQRIGSNAVDQCVGLFGGGDDGDAPGGLRGADQPGWVRRDRAFAKHEFEERSYGGQLAADRDDAEAGFVQASKPFAEL